MDNVEIPKWLKDLPLAPEFRPTVTEFADPIAFISKIEKQASVFGICKIIPPLPKPSKRYVFNNLNTSLVESCDLLNRVSEDKAVFTTRQQELGQDLKKNRVQGQGKGNVPQSGALKQVWQSGEVYTLKQFECKSKSFSRSILGKIKDITPQTVESLFWKACGEKPIYVEYANDVPGSGFGKPDGLLHNSPPRKRQRRGMLHYCVEGNVNTVNTAPSGKEVKVSGLGPCSISQPGNKLLDSTSEGAKQGGFSEMEGTAGWKLSNSPWNLQVIARAAGSLTRFMLDDIPGVTSPMVYIGMLFSWFAWHVEDHELHSLNFLHMGSSKTWYAVPGSYAFAFEDVIRRQAYGGDVDNLASLKLLGEKTTLLSPELVIASGVPCCRLVQNPGEFVVTFPRAYHMGFSHGFNCGEAANFGTPQWLAVAKDAAMRRTAMDHLPMLSHQQLLYLLTMSFISRVPQSFLSGTRGSRLRDHLKEERELLVKKAFIENMLKESNLLNMLLGKDNAFRAVLWHPNLLPSFAKDSLSQTGIVPDPISDKNNELPEIGPNSVYHQQASCLKAVDDLYLDSDDVAREFQVDYATLPCVTCGILGYPFMAVVQPSKKAASEIFRHKHQNKNRLEAEFVQKAELFCHRYTTKNPTTGGRVTSGFLRPQIFCLEHAVQVEELLRCKGGARVIVICHSDFQKIKANATVIAEEIGNAFNYKDVILDFASKEELNLIDFAIESGDLPADSKEDWASKLGMNVRSSVKARISWPAKKIEPALNLEYLLSIAPGSVTSAMKWCARKTRTKRVSRFRELLKSHDGEQLEKTDDMIHDPCGSMQKRGKVLLHYSRKKYRVKSTNYSGPKHVSGCSVQSPPEVLDGNHMNNVVIERVTSGASRVENREPHFEELCTTSSSTKNCDMLRGEDEMTKPIMEHASSIVFTDPIGSQTVEAVVQLNLPLETLSTADPSFLEKTKVNEKADMDKDLDRGGGCVLPDDGMLDMENPKAIIYDSMRDEYESNDRLPEICEPLTVGSSEEIDTEQDGENLRMSKISGHACNMSVAKVPNIVVPDKACIRQDEIHDHAASGVSGLHGANDETNKLDCISTCTAAVEFDALPKPNSTDCSDGDMQSSPLPLQVKSEMDRNGKTITDADMTPQKRSKRKREVMKQTETHNGFVRSPCEGLRPRQSKEASTSKSKSNVSSKPTEQQKPPAKKIKKSSRSSISRDCGEPRDSDTGYKCNQEGCKMFFKTRKELSLHKRCICHVKGCGKKFRSHRYFVVHQRVHDNKRPLKCTWEGCAMTFKWAWARTEHLRLHTGERPYKCKVKGCDRTFMFVSDFSRHRRKTGHHSNSST